MSTPEKNTYKIAGPATWELIRAAYLAGESAPALAARCGVSIHAIRKRATVEKWTKRDYAAALEARGLRREQPKPNFIEQSVLQEELRQAAAAREAAERESEMDALVEQIASEQDAADIANALERRALAQAGAAMVRGRSREAAALAAMAEQMRKRVAAAASSPLVLQREAEIASPADLEQRALAKAGEALARGDAGEAKALTAVAEQMRRRVEEERAAATAAVEAEEVGAAEIENEFIEFFARVAKIASCMVHQPSGAPAAFMQLMKRWREINLGEGEADAEKRAAAMVEAQRRHLDGSWYENTPEDVRAYLQARWEEVRIRLAEDGGKAAAGMYSRGARG